MADDVRRAKFFESKFDLEIRAFKAGLQLVLGKNGGQRGHYFVWGAVRVW